MTKHKIQNKHKFQISNNKTFVLVFVIWVLDLFCHLDFDICYLHFSIHKFSFATVQVLEESPQQINEFSLAGYGEKGKKTWELFAKSADIFEDSVKLKEIVGNLYNEQENIKLTADKGNFDKVEGSVHLEQNVTVTTTSGAQLTTDALDWDRKNQLVTTKSIVNIKRENIITTAQGAMAEPGLNKVTLEKDVAVEIKQENKTTITCDGPLEIEYDKKKAKFRNNVKVDNKDIQIYSEQMDVYFIASEETGAPDKNSKFMGSRIEKIVAQGNVKIVRGENVSYSDEAIYTAADKKITLSGKPKLVIYSTENLNASFGN